MLILLSPAKTLNFNIKPQTQSYTQPVFAEKSAELVIVLKRFSPSILQKLMSINPKLAELNVQRYLDWSLPFTPDNARQALLVFNGEVYNGLKAGTLTPDELDYAQNHLLILSGLYGALRPLDLIQPYRLEMGTKLKIGRKNDLYAFWGDQITGFINETLKNTGQKYVINLASDEYFDVIRTEKLNAEIITPQFKDFSNGSYKFITVFGKKARGMMARFIIQKKVEEVEQLKLFDEEGYYFNENLSKGNTWVFTRG
ncbi:MAG: peroxide stress protein YaaA [Bacteroidales bacterium]|nr:peroxide stress protein YaaA [Bacteroidales bacterium]